MSENDKMDYAALQAVAEKEAKAKAEVVAKEQKSWDAAQRDREIINRLAELQAQIDKEDVDLAKKLSEASKDLKVVKDAAEKSKATYDAACVKTDKDALDALRQRAEEAPAAQAAARVKLDAATQAVDEAESVAKDARSKLEAAAKDYKDAEALTKALPEALTKARQAFEKKTDKDEDATREAKRSLDEASAELEKAIAHNDFRQAAAESDHAHAVAEIRAKQAELAKTLKRAEPHRP